MSTSKKSLPFLAPLNVLFRHMHEEEEIRYVISGSGYFDVRGKALPPFFSNRDLNCPFFLSKKSQPMLGSALQLSLEIYLSSLLECITASRLMKVIGS